MHGYHCELLYLEAVSVPAAARLHWRFLLVGLGLGAFNQCPSPTIRDDWIDPFLLPVDVAVAALNECSFDCLDRTMIRWRWVNGGMDSKAKYRYRMLIMIKGWNEWIGNWALGGVSIHCSVRQVLKHTPFPLAACRLQKPVGSLVHRASFNHSLHYCELLPSSQE